MDCDQGRKPDVDPPSRSTRHEPQREKCARSVARCADVVRSGRYDRHSRPVQAAKQPLGAVRRWSPGLFYLRNAGRWAAYLGNVGLREETVQYGPVVTRPEKIVMMGFNYRKHAEETNTPTPKNPVLFNKYNNSLNQHGGTIKLPTDV